MNISSVLAVWITVFSTLSVPVSDATDNNNRKLPRLSSFYLDDGSCSEHIGETTQRVIWNGRPWNLTAPESLVSPPSETKRNGTPLDISPLNDFVTQAHKLGAIIVNGDRAIAADTPVGLRLVMVVHDLVAEGPGIFIANDHCCSPVRFDRGVLRERAVHWTAKRCELNGMVEKSEIAAMD
jgi:hypothetical protein